MIDPQWAQGALVEPNDTRDHITAEDVTANDVLIVVSQSCDVVCASYELEPSVELHIGRPIEEIDGNNSFGKNPRALDLETTINGKARALRILDHERKRIPRQTLEDLLPVGCMPDDDIRMVAKWTANRYTRPALPDAFNGRRASAKDAITKLIRRVDKVIEGFYVALNTFDELPDGTDYQAAFMSITPKGIADDVNRFPKVVEVTNAVAGLLKVRGIAVVDVAARSASEVSLEDIAYYKRLEFDYISERHGGERPVE